jgi:NADPH2:quinone reductase
MRVIEVGRRGGPEVLNVAERAAPDPGPGQVVVRIARRTTGKLLLIP